MSDDEEFSFSLSSDKPDTGEPGVDSGLLSEENAASMNEDPALSPGDDVAEAGEDEEDGEVEPVEVLVTLAKNGKIDPWDIDIVAVTDAFLQKLDEADLRASGRALFYASVLLRMKSDAMLNQDEPEEEEPEPWEVAMEGGADGHPGEPEPGFDPVDALEDEMDRRLERKSTRGTPETLDELVRELREAERGSRWKESRSYDTSNSPQGFSRGTQTLDYHAADDFRREDEPTEADVTGTTHDEEIETVIVDVGTALRERYDRGREEVLFTEVRDAGGRPMMTYLGLLFLSHRGDARLQQDELFGDLWIQNPETIEIEEPGGAGVEMEDGEEGDDSTAVAVDDDD
ncbi:chromosome segregation and condensation protein ScpA [halophilic archaeon DL31]|jgi:segregation and condensation protein A|nr:chromosome segregation and condensation protein ScpA [halophilic archaeon DL31]